MDLSKVMQEMINENLSIREMAKRLGIPKSTLHYRLNKVKKRVDDEFLLVAYDILMKENKDNMSEKGINKRWQK